MVPIALDHAAMRVAPGARFLERTRPKTGRALACPLLLRLVIAIGDRPSSLDLRAVETDAAGFAIAEKPAIAVALTSRARNRLVARQPGQGLARGAATCIAIPLFRQIC